MKKVMILLHNIIPEEATAKQLLIGFITTHEFESKYFETWNVNGKCYKN